MVFLLPHLSWAQAAAASAPERYRLRDADDFRWYRGGGSAYGGLPFNKPWAALTNEQQEAFRNNYAQLASPDEPPFPLEGLAALYDPVIRGQGKIFVEGTFIAEVNVDASGVPLSIEVRQTPSPAATRLVAGVALLTKFKPGSCQGQPCTMPFPLFITFKVR